MAAFDLVLAPLLPLGALTPLALAALLLALFGIWRRARGGWLRLVFSAVMLLLLLNPAFLREQREPLQDIALVVLDRSPSQDLGKRREQTDVAFTELEKKISALPDTQLRVIEASGSESAGEEGTFLFQEIRRVLAEVSRDQVGAIFIVSDGQVHDAPETAEALGIDAPLHLLRTGSDAEADRRLTLVNAPGYALVGRPIDLTFRVDDLPEAQESHAQVRLLVNGQEVQAEAVAIGKEHSFSIELERRGMAAVELEVEAAPEEVTLVNNRAAAIVNGVRDRLRVLLISGEPHLGERAWRNILKSDASVELVHFTILRPPEKQDATPIDELALIAFPTRELFELKLQEFDLVILDRYTRRGILPTSYYENLTRYVEEGGGLLEAAGPATAGPLSIHTTPLRNVLPGAPTGRIVEAGFKPRVTDLGLRHPVTAELAVSANGQEEPPWGRWFRLIETQPENGDVLMSGAEDLPLLVLLRAGDGRSAQINSDQIWLWSRGFEDGGPQAELLRRTAHWLMKEPDLEEEDLRAKVEDGALLVTRRSLDDPAGEVEVTLPSGDRRALLLKAVSPGTGLGRMPVEETGLYRITDGERVALVPAGPGNSREFEDPRATSEVLAPLLKETGGTHMALENGMPKLRKVAAGRSRHGRDWMGVVARGSYLVTGVERVMLLPGLLALLLVLGALLMAWRREGR